MATLDIILLCCFIPGIIRGLSKGFLEQALALAGIVLSVWAAFHFSSLVCTWLKPYVNVSETTLNVISFALILIVISLLGNSSRKWRNSPCSAGWTRRSAWCSPWR